MSSTIYNHRNLQPMAQNSGPTHSTARLNECLETIKQEFVDVLRDSSVLKSKSDDYAGQLTSQINELNIIRQAMYDLEAQHSRIRQRYEEDLLKLRNELHQARHQAHNTPQYPPGLAPDSASAQPPLQPPQTAQPLPQLTQQPPQQQQQSQQQQPVDDPAPQVQQQVASPHLYGALNLENVPAEYKKHGQDWFAIFNPRVPRVLDVSPMHTFSHESVVCCVRFSPDGRFLATGGNRSAQIYDVRTGQKTHVLVDESASQTGDLYIRSVCFSPDGKYLATGAEDRLIRIWDIARQRIRTVFEGHGQEIIYSIAFSADGALVVCGSGDRNVRIWSMEGAGMATVLAVDAPETVEAGVTSVAISPDGRFVAAGSVDTVVRIWDVATGTLVERLRGHMDSVYSVAFTPDGKGLVSGSIDKMVKLWDIASLYQNGVQSLAGTGSAGKEAGGERGSMCLMNYKGHRDYVLSVAVSHDGQWIASGSKDRSVQFWHTRNPAVQLTLQGHKNSVISIDLSPTSGMLATGSGDSQARVWRFGLQG